MTILNINKYHFVKGGAERFYFELAKLLEKKGHQVVPFAMRHAENEKSKHAQYFVSEVVTDNTEARFIASHPWQALRTVSRYFWSFEAARKLKKLIKQEKPKVAILHNIYHQISPSILPVLKKNKIPIVLVAHDYGLLSPNYSMLVRGQVYDKICGSKFLRCVKDKCVKNSFAASLVSSLEMWFHHSVLNVYQKNIDYILCPSRFMQNMFLRAGWNKEKIIHLPYFIKKQEYKNTKAIKDEKDYILYFGRLSVEKGIDTLINAVRELPGIKIKIAGTGPEEKKYKTQITGNKLQNIKMVGYKSGEELQALVKSAKFIIVPSIWYENYPLSILEAYSFGVPALVSNMGGLPEMIPGDNKNFIFKAGGTKELGKKIKYLYDNDEIIKQAGEKAKEFIKQNNNPEKYYQALLNILKKDWF